MNTFHRLDNLVSENTAGIKISAIKEMAMLSAKVEDAASLAWGLPSFRTPEYIRQGVIEGLQHDIDIGKYALPDGLPELRRLVAEKHELENAVSVDPDRNVMITAGNMQGLSTIFHVLTDPGDEIILTDPCFASHIQQIKQCGGKPVYWPLNEEDGWRLNLATLPSLITDKTKAIVIVSPSNPTGKIFSKSELLGIGRIAKQKGLMILIDDPYCHFTYDQRAKYFNLAAEKELTDHIVYCFTFSKAYAMSGWRLGYMILPEPLKKEAVKVHDLNMICTPRISQVAGIVALRGKPLHLLEFEAILAKRRELICERLDVMPQVFTYNKPEGAYYVFPKIVAQHRDSYEFSLRLLNEAKVTVTPGSAFGPSGEHHVRMAYCVSDDMINRAFDRIEVLFGI
ncbi:pyridoxal phosphate-dependent aminotransferase [Methylomarinum vadi]|uniref:pyridoxal phosphate-dependent aminotransferase n=1 Tax=Methylomarinum vadi TaxID=438855 RepID=UPI0004DF403C|nr:pyridoxal phosphate-dependent aminotransferase [Methylomarinum vadi]